MRFPSYAWPLDGARLWSGGRRPPDMSNFCCLPGRADNTKTCFIYSEDLCNHLNRMIDSPWHDYKGRELKPNNLAFLLKEYDITPSKDDTGSKRGYYLKAFADAWLRILGLQLPKHAKAY
jgi:Protein of unknown function (DUF3631)